MSGGGRGRWAGPAARPLVVALLLGGLWLWLRGQELDSIERRTINADYLLRATREHLWLTVVATLAVAALALPLGVLLTRPALRRVAPGVLAVLGVGQAVPAYGVMVLLTLRFGVGFRVAAVALVAYSLLPVLRNVVTGIGQVDPALVEAGRGMGMSRAAVLWRIELPLAVPVVLTGLRTAMVIGAGVATLATFVGAGGLGDIIINGIKLGRTPVLVTGSVLCACVALALDWAGAVAERALSPRGVS